MTCPFCQSWNQKQPNCGHGLINGLHAPAKYLGRSYIEGGELTGRVMGYARAENTGSRDSRLEHITRQAHIAADGGWKAAS